MTLHLNNDLINMQCFICLQDPRVLHEERSDHLQRAADQLRDGGQGPRSLRGD